MRRYSCSSYSGIIPNTPIGSSAVCKRPSPYGIYDIAHMYKMKINVTTDCKAVASMFAVTTEPIFSTYSTTSSKNLVQSRVCKCIVWTSRRPLLMSFDSVAVKFVWRLRHRTYASCSLVFVFQKYLEVLHISVHWGFVSRLRQNRCGLRFGFGARDTRKLRLFCTSVLGGRLQQRRC